MENKVRFVKEIKVEGDDKFKFSIEVDIEREMLILNGHYKSKVGISGGNFIYDTATVKYELKETKNENPEDIFNNILENLKGEMENVYFNTIKKVTSFKKIDTFLKDVTEIKIERNG